jgi:chromosome segregation ATPase
MNKVTFFVKQFAAFVTGDDTTARALKEFRKAESGLKTQIAILEGETIAKEEAVQAAEDAIAFSRVNGGNNITSPTSYVQNLLDAKNNLTSAQEKLKTHQAKLDFLKGELETLKTEVEETVK